MLNTWHLPLAFDVLADPGEGFLVFKASATTPSLPTHWAVGNPLAVAAADFRDAEIDFADICSNENLNACEAWIFPSVSQRSDSDSLEASCAAFALALLTLYDDQLSAECSTI